MYLEQNVLDEICRRIVEAVSPLRVVLFGSAARGEMTADSDVDVLVVMPEGTNRIRTSMNIHRKLFGIDAAVDVMVATPADLEKYGDSPYLIYRAVLHEGQELYNAAA